MFNRLLSYWFSHFGRELKVGDLIFNKISKLQIVTKDILDSGLYSIYNMVIPLPTNETIIPPLIKGYYKEILDECEISENDWNRSVDIEMKNRKQYRFGLVKPSDFSYQFYYYISFYILIYYYMHFLIWYKIILISSS